MRSTTLNVTCCKLHPQKIVNSFQGATKKVITYHFFGWREHVQMSILALSIKTTLVNIIQPQTGINDE